MSAFKIGDRVCWESQAAGTWKHKTGIVEMVVPVGKRPEIKGAGWNRDHESYVVRVGRKAYWPRVAALKTAK